MFAHFPETGDGPDSIGGRPENADRRPGRGESSVRPKRKPETGPGSIDSESLAINNSVGVSLSITPGFNPVTGDRLPDRFYQIKNKRIIHIKYFSIFESPLISQII